MILISLCLFLLFIIIYFIIIIIFIDMELILAPETLLMIHEMSCCVCFERKSTGLEVMLTNIGVSVCLLWQDGIIVHW